MPTPGPLRLAIAVLPWHLDVGLSRAVAFADQGQLVVAGGLTATGTTSEVRLLDVGTGRVSDFGHLQRPVHDASGAVIGGRLLVFGGGSSVAGSTVQVVSPGTTGKIIGRLPAARADLSTVVVGDRVFVIGGGSANRQDPRIWATTDGAGARLVGRLRIGVRYAATAASGSSIFVFGGATAGGDRDEIQQFDTTTGRTSLVGRLPVRLSHATAMVLGGRILVIGGTSSDTIWSFDPGRLSVTRVGRLPYQVSDAASVVIGDRGYLIGGEDRHPLDTVITLALQ
jgi:N-acetylneuraminic acid mutarotase